MMLRFLAISALVACFAAPAEAQRIYSWRDESGNLVLSNIEHPTDAAVKSYSVGRDNGVQTTTRIVPTRAALYEDLIVQHAQLNGLRPDLVRAVVQVESGFNQYARSPKG